MAIEEGRGIICPTPHPPPPKGPLHITVAQLCKKHCPAFAGGRPGAPKERAARGRRGRPHRRRNQPNLSRVPGPGRSDGAAAPHYAQEGLLPGVDEVGCTAGMGDEGGGAGRGVTKWARLVLGLALW